MSHRKRGHCLCGECGHLPLSKWVRDEGLFFLCTVLSTSNTGIGRDQLLNIVSLLAHKAYCTHMHSYLLGLLLLGALHEKPLVVDEYNHSMNGVDKSDQYTVYYSFKRRSHKWWQKWFFWLFEVTLVNSFILYQTTVSNPLPISNIDRVLLIHLSIILPLPLLDHVLVGAVSIKWLTLKIQRGSIFILVTSLNEEHRVFMGNTNI